MEKKLWCISIKLLDDESETIFHAKALAQEEAIELATEYFVENHGFYQGDRDLFEGDNALGIINTYAFEVTDILGR